MLFEELSFDAVSFYETFTPIKKEISVPSNLVPFVKAMSDHHRLDLSISESLSISSDDKFELDENVLYYSQVGLTALGRSLTLSIMGTRFTLSS